MSNQRGSALLNVLAVVAMLLIIGLALMQTINSDAVLAIRDADVTHAIQMAEGGIDFGMEMLIAGAEEILGEGSDWPSVGEAESSPFQPFTIEADEGTVEVTVEAIEAGKKYLITSQSWRENATRVIQAEVSQYTSGDPFPYSLFVGGQGSTNEEGYDLYLSNVTIDGSVYIAADHVHIDSNTRFNHDVHFNCIDVKIHKNTSFDVYRGKATKEPDTEIIGPTDDPKHWTSLITVESNPLDMPDIPTETYADEPEFTQHGSGSILFAELDKLNYFDGDITIYLEKDDYPTETKMVVVSTGTVHFEALDSSFQLHPPNDTVLIVMAEEDITGLGKLTTKSTGQNSNVLDLYLYAKGTIESDQNVWMSSVMAQMVSFHNQNQTIQAPDPRIFDDLPWIIKEHWGLKGFAITKWIN